jgi:3D (Asp-Asp-Asp) domain-containing protein
VVAVDPSVIKLGSRVHVEGYGDAIAGDTGGAIRGSRIDLCFDTYDEAIQFGRRTIKVYILKTP